MLGNLFTQRKSVDTSQDGFTPSAPPVPQAPIVPSVVGDDAPRVVGSDMKPQVRQDMSVMTHLDTRTTQVLTQAQQETKRIKQAMIEPAQILYGLLCDAEIFKLLSDFSLDVGQLAKEVQTKEQEGTFVDSAPTLSSDAKGIFEAAFQVTKKRDASFIAPEDLLVALFASGLNAVDSLKTAGVTREKLEEKLVKSGGYSVGKKSVLDQFGVDLTEKAKKGDLDPIAGRDKEIERVVHILLRRTKNNPIIIGEAGVGKTAIVEGLAFQIVSGKAPKDLLGKRIIQLDVSSLVAGASHRGEFEERLRNVIKEAMANTQVILFIDEIHTLIGAGDTDGAMDASNIIKPYLARGQLQIIGTTTTAEFRKYFEKDKAFERRFQSVIAEEPTEEVAIEMLKVLKPKYEKFHSVTMPDETLVQAVKLSKKYIGERYLPDKAVDLLDEAAAEVKLTVGSGKRQDSVVAKSDIEKIVSSWTGIPITKLTEDESQKLLNLDKLIHQRFIDQEEAVTAVSEAVRRGRIGLAAANRPIASFVFLGPTGVGKTELAKTMAEILFGRDDAMIRLDMSEYMEKHEVAKLIGAPPGYVGYEEGGQLTEAVRAKPYSIVLLDEVEKAHPDVFNILLQLLEDGRLTDNKGNTISFKNTIIVATSNIGSSMIQQKLISQGTPNPVDATKNFAELKELVSGELHKFFRPELLNRFDEIVIFKPLAASDMAAIAKLGIEKTGKLLKEQGYGLQISQNGIAQLAKEGYDPIYGARPLRRLVQTAIENPIALQIISKNFIPGDTILIDYDTQKGVYTFLKAAPQAGNQSGEARSSSAGQIPQPPIVPKPPTPPVAGGVGEIPVSQVANGQPAQPASEPIFQQPTGQSSTSTLPSANNGAAQQMNASSSTSSYSA